MVLVEFYLFQKFLFDVLLLTVMMLLCHHTILYLPELSMSALHVELLFPLVTGTLVPETICCIQGHFTRQSAPIQLPILLVVWHTKIFYE